MKLRAYQRYVAIGDSSTEGLDDPDGRGHYRGWADRLAAHLAAHREARLEAHREVHREAGPMLYANLGVRGRTTREIRQGQLAPALAMRPDLVTLFSGTNDVIRGGFDVAAVRDDLAAMHGAIRATGAMLLTFTLPDLAGVIPFARRISPRVAALNDAIREVAASHGSTLVDLAMHPVASDPRLWSDDRLHANATGHARIAAALALAAGVPGHLVDERWAEPLDPPSPPAVRFHGRLATELRWVRRHLLPWAWRHARGRSSGDGITAKRPALAPVELRP
jgi:lysophospholipase L1-like esterase